MQVLPTEEPWATNYARQADDALAAATSMSAEQLRALRPPLPQIEWLPPRFGYPAYADRQPDVMQVFGINRVSPAGLPPMPRMSRDQRVDYSREQGGYQGSDRNTNADPLGMGAGGN